MGFQAGIKVDKSREVEVEVEERARLLMWSERATFFEAKRLRRTCKLRKKKGNRGNDDDNDNPR